LGPLPEALAFLFCQGSVQQVRPYGIKSFAPTLVESGLVPEVLPVLLVKRSFQQFISNEFNKLLWFLVGRVPLTGCCPVQRNGAIVAGISKQGSKVRGNVS
jgi:hypothetical protein